MADTEVSGAMFVDDRSIGLEELQDNGVLPPKTSVLSSDMLDIPVMVTSIVSPGAAYLGDVDISTGVEMTE